MSQQLINLSQDLKRLRDEGYEIEIISNYLVLKNVPYVNHLRQIKFGYLISTLTMSGNITARPDTHVIQFNGEYPCDKKGSPILKIQHQSCKKNITDKLVSLHSFSSKPTTGYTDYYHKMTTYAAILSSPAHAIDQTTSPITFKVVSSNEENDIFNYLDTASSRSEIVSITAKLALNKVAIVGLGGTGSYILDLISKTPINEIHLFDQDIFLQHNAFRAPGAPSIEELQDQMKKVNYFCNKYSKMHKGIIPHDYFIDDSNAIELQEMSFVFLCLDDGQAKKIIVNRLHYFQIPYIDVGMGLYLTDNALGGVLRVTTSTNDKNDHIINNKRIPFSNDNGKNEYNQNIQIADLNSLNATLAVIKWKKILGFYHDFDQEHFSTYTLDGNLLTNEDKI